MQKRWYPIALFMFSLLWLGCEEIAPTLNPITGGTGGNNSGNVETQQRQVLVEEFTGVRCVNCPAGAQAIEALRAAHGQRLVPVSIHAGFFAQPYPQSAENLANPVGASIMSYVGSPLGFPTAVVNRRQFSGEASLQVGQGTWAGYVAEELASPPRIKIDIVRSYEAATGRVTGKVVLYPQENITDNDVRYTLYLVQDHIFDYQLTPAGVEPTYEHRHVFRAAITSPQGDVIQEPLVANTSIEKAFSFALDNPNWVADDCYLVAFVHLNGDRKDVLQAHEAKIVD